MGCAFDDDDDDDDDDGAAVDASDSVRGGDSDMDRDGAGSWKVSEWWWWCCCSTTNGDGVAVDELCDEGAMALAAVVVVDDDVDGEGPTKNCCKILVRCAVPAPVQSIHPSIHVRRQVVMAVEYPVLVVSGVRIDMKVTR